MKILLISIICLSITPIYSKEDFDLNAFLKNIGKELEDFSNDLKKEDYKQLTEINEFWNRGNASEFGNIAKLDVNLVFIAGILEEILWRHHELSKKENVPTPDWETKQQDWKEKFGENQEGTYGSTWQEYWANRMEKQRQHFDDLLFSMFEKYEELDNETSTIFQIENIAQKIDHYSISLPSYFDGQSTIDVLSKDENTIDETVTIICEMIVFQVEKDKKYKDYEEAEIIQRQKEISDDFVDGIKNYLQKNHGMTKSKTDKMWNNHKSDQWESPLDFIEEYGNNTEFKEIFDKLKKDHPKRDATIKDIMKDLSNNKTSQQLVNEVDKDRMERFVDKISEHIDENRQQQETLEASIDEQSIIDKKAQDKKAAELETKNELSGTSKTKGVLIICVIIVAGLFVVLLALRLVRQKRYSQTPIDSTYQNYADSASNI